MLIGDALREVGFEVTTALNADLGDMRREIRRFGSRLRAAGGDAIGLFYFAGHGVQSRGVNYLIPLSSTVESEPDLSFEAIAASDVLSQMEFAGNRLNLVILDACRNNPFKGDFRSTGRGLARIQSASGSLVAFSAAPGQVASDGRGPHSPYTEALVRAIGEPGLSVEQVFKRVRVEVERKTSGAQTPWEESSLRGDFYFKRKVVAPTTARQKPSPPKAGGTAEITFWKSIEDIGSASAYSTYLDQYPDGAFAPIAKIRLSEFEKKVEERPPPVKTSPDAAPNTATSGKDTKPPEKPANEFHVQTLRRTMYALKASNIRSGPGTEFEKIDFVRVGQRMAVTGQVNGRSWYRVSRGDAPDGFVFSKLLGNFDPTKSKSAKNTSANSIASRTTSPTPGQRSKRNFSVKNLKIECEHGTWMKYDTATFSGGVIRSSKTGTILRISVKNGKYAVDGKYCFAKEKICGKLHLKGSIPSTRKGTIINGTGWIDMPGRNFCNMTAQLN